MNAEKARLIALAAKGDRDAAEALIRDNAGLVRSIARRFTGRGVDYDDLCQLGNIGMLKAIRNFRLEMGTEFSTYAVPLIIGEIKRFLRDDGSIKIGREIKKRAYAAKAFRESFMAQNGREPTVSELAAGCGMSEEDAVECISATVGTVSLSNPVGEAELIDFIGADFTPETNEKIALEQAIGKLDSEEREIIGLRYYRGMTQSETGRMMGLTQVTVSRREAKALRRLREELV